MKINISELRDMVAETIRMTISEAKKAKKSSKEMPMRSEESEAAQRDRHVRGMPGYSHSKPNDFSKPLGTASLTKRQGASGMGGWTSESIELEAGSVGGGGMKTDVQDLLSFCKFAGMDDRKAKEYVGKWLKHNSGGMNAPTSNTSDDPDALSPPSEIGLESTVREKVHEMQVRKMIRMIVGEELRFIRGAR